VKKLALAIALVVASLVPLHAQSQASGAIALTQINEGTGSTATYFSAYFWVAFTDANGQKQDVLLSINSNPANYTAYLVGGPYGPTRVYYAITSFAWTRTASSSGVVSFHLHNADAEITDIQADSLVYQSSKPCTRCSVQTWFTSLNGTYEYTTEVQ
jgi:hypothetical protein